MFQFLRRLFGGSTNSAPEVVKLGDRGDKDAARSGSSRESLPPADLIGPPEAGTPIVVVVEGNMSMILDRMGYEYQRGMTPGDPPSQDALDRVLRRTTRVRALDGGMYRENSLGMNILFEEEDPAALRGLLNALRISEDPETFSHCMCLGGPTLEFFDDGELIATIAVHHGRSIRWPAWKHDAILKVGRDLVGWMAARGVELGEGPSNPEDPMMMEVLSLKPGDRLAARANSYIQLGSPVRSLAELDLAEETDPSLIIVPALRAEAFFYLGRFDEGRAAAEEAIGRGFHNPQVLKTLAACLDGLGRPEEGLVRADEAIALDPAHADARNSRGTILGRLGRLDEARAEYTESARLAPDWVLPVFHLAMLDFQMGRPAEAIESLTRSLELLESSGVPPAERVLGPYSIAALHAIRACCRLMLGDPEASLADSDRAIELDPDDPNGYAHKGRALSMLGRPAEAVEVFETLTRIASDSPMAWTYLAHAHAGSGDFEAALGAIDEAMRLETENPQPLAFRAQLLLSLERVAEAIEDIGTAINLRPDNPDYYMIRSQCHGVLGDFGRQIEDLRTARRWAPDDPMVLNNLAWYLSTCPVAALRDGPLAESLAIRAADLTDGRDADVLGTLSAALAENGRFPEARRRLRQAIELDPTGDNSATREAMRLAFDEERPYRL